MGGPTTDINHDITQKSDIWLLFAFMTLFLIRAGYYRLTLSIEVHLKKNTWPLCQGFQIQTLEDTDPPKVKLLTSLLMCSGRKQKEGMGSLQLQCNLLCLN